MTQEEVNKTFDELKQEGMNDNDMLVALGKMYQNGDITKDQLGALIYELGYEFTEEFAGKSDEEAKNSMFEESQEGEPESEEKPEEKPEGEEEGKDKPEEGEEKPEPEDKPEGDEEEERKQAMSLFGRK